VKCYTFSVVVKTLFTRGFLVIRVVGTVGKGKDLLQGEWGAEHSCSKTAFLLALGPEPHADSIHVYIKCIASESR
jgi:hypothetical protein